MCLTSFLGEGHLLGSVMWWVPDGRVKRCSWADPVNGSRERGPISLVTHPLPYAWSCSAERYLGFCLGCHAPSSSGHTRSAQLHHVGAPWYLQIQLGWQMIPWIMTCWETTTDFGKKNFPFPLSLVEFFMFKIWSQSGVWPNDRA